MERSFGISHGEDFGSRAALSSSISAPHQSHSFLPEDSQQGDAAAGKQEEKLNKKWVKWHILGLYFG